MVAEQVEARGIHDERVLEAMRKVPREAFTDADDRKRAYEDIPIQIGWGQTISQPYMVALICEEASVRPGARVLDVGTGSGYQAAVLAELGAEVHSIERLRQLAGRAREKLDAAGFDSTPFGPEPSITDLAPIALQHFDLRPPESMRIAREAARA